MKSSFGECLSKLLNSFNINASKLAKGINTDQSLVYKWLRGERLPSYDSNYIDLITNYLSENLNMNPHFKSRIAALLSDKEELSDNLDIKLEMRNMLYRAQTYSFDVKNNEKEVITGYATEKTESFQLELQKEEENSKVRVITGIRELIENTIDLVSKASKKVPCKSPILILLNSNMSHLDLYDGVNLRWKNALLDAIQNGWEVILLIRLNENIKRTTKLVEDMLATLYTNRFHVSYIDTKSEINIGNDLIIVPNVGALFFFSSHIKDQVDSAFLFEATDSIENLTGHFYQYFSMAKPLYVAYSSQKYIEFHKLLTIAEGQPGDRLVFKGGHFSIIVPSDLYMKYLKQTVQREDEISRRLDLHSKRIEAFKAQIKYYKYREIWFKESIQRQIFKKENEQYILGNYIPDKDDIISYLSAVIGMLQEHENYEVALVNGNDYPDINRISWMVKGHSYVFLESINDTKSEINLAMTEENLVAAVHQYYQNIWNNIPQPDKDKARVIDWLNSLIVKINDGK